MKNLSVARRLLIIFTSALFALLLLGMLSMWGMNKLGMLQDEGFKSSQDASLIAEHAAMGPKLYLVIADSIINHNLTESAQEWKAVKAETEGYLKESATIAGSAEEKQWVADANTAYQHLVKVYEERVLPLLQTNAALDDIRQHDAEIDGQVEVMRAALTHFAESRSKESSKADTLFDEARRHITIYSAVAALSLLIIMSVISWHTSRSITQQLGGEPTYAMKVCQQIASGDFSGKVEILGSAEPNLMASIKQMQEHVAQLIQEVGNSALLVVSAAENLAEVAQQVSISSSQQSGDTASVAAAVEQLTVSIDHVASHASNAQSVAADSGKRSEQGASQVNEATSEMSRISDSVHTTSAQMNSLAAQSQQIRSIANVIKEVADQTNLLALNAAIEAARAGEQGRGFAVVADEVRKLAERTTASAQEISAMITSILSYSSNASASMEQASERVTQGVAIAQRAGESMQQVSERVSAVINAVTEISYALAEQKSASSEIARRVEHIAQATEENSAAVNNVAETSYTMKALAEQLKRSVANFKI